MSLDEKPGMPFDRFNHPLPDGFGEPPDHRVVMMDQPLSPFIMIPDNENGGPQLPEEPPTFVYIIKVIVCCIGVIGIAQSSCAKTRKIVSVSEVDDLIRLELFAEQQRGS